MRARAVVTAFLIGFTATGTGACGTLPVGAPGGGATAPGATVSASAGTGTASPAASPPVSSPPASPPPVPGCAHCRVLTVADNGARVRLRVGQRVIVFLTSGGGMMWDLPTASGGALRRISASGGYPTAWPALAVFRAVRPGTAALTSITDARCLHSAPPCELAQRLWTVTVIVRS